MYTSNHEHMVEDKCLMQLKHIFRDFLINFRELHNGAVNIGHK